MFLLEFSRKFVRIGLGVLLKVFYRFWRSIVKIVLELVEYFLGDFVYFIMIVGDVYCYIFGILGDIKYNVFCMDCIFVMINYCERVFE